MTRCKMIICAAAITALAGTTEAAGLSLGANSLSLGNTISGGLSVGANAAGSSSTANVSDRSGAGVANASVSAPGNGGVASETAGERASASNQTSPTNPARTRVIVLSETSTGGGLSGTLSTVVNQSGSLGSLGSPIEPSSAVTTNTKTTSGLSGGL